MHSLIFKNCFSSFSRIYLFWAATSSAVMFFSLPLRFLETSCRDLPLGYSSSPESFMLEIRAWLIVISFWSFFKYSSVESLKMSGASSAAI